MIKTTVQHLVETSRELRFLELRYNTLYLCKHYPEGVFVAFYNVENPSTPKVVNLLDTKMTFAESELREFPSNLRFYPAPEGTTVLMEAVE